MNPLDLTLIGIVSAFAAIGALRGGVAEALSLMVWGAAGVIAWLFAEEAAPWFARGIIDETGRRIMGFVAIFIVSFMVLTLLSFVVRKTLFLVPPRGWSRLFGAVLGAGRGLMVAAILVGLAGLTRLPQEAWWRGSRLAPPLQSLTLRLVSHLPDDLAIQFRYR